MSTSIDSKVVQMKFDNASFEKNVETSMSSLSKLNKTLAMSESAKGLEGIGAAARNVDLSGMQTGIEKIHMQFSALEIVAVTAFANITNSALEAGKRMVSAITVDPIMTGLSEYETKMNAIQVIQANTQGVNTMDDITSALDNLNTYADQTIYNFAQMTSNVGKFVAQGLDVDKSTAALKGMANLAAASGASAEDMSRATYQMSQSLGGTLLKIDWNSLRNANMATTTLKNTLIEIAKTENGLDVNAMIADSGTFENTLELGWLSGGMFTEAMNIYSDTYSEAELKAKGFNDEQIKKFKDIAKMAKEAATEVKTITQLWGVLIETAQSGWTQSWEYIFGDFVTAKASFTQAQVYFSGIINASSDARNAILKEWNDLGGRDVVIKALQNIFNGLLNVLKPIREAFVEVFPPTTGKQLYGITVAFEKLTEFFSMSAEELDSLKFAFKGFFSVISLIGKVIGGIIKTVWPLTDLFVYLGGGILTVAGAIGKWLVSVNNANSSFTFLSNIMPEIVEGIKTFIDMVTQDFVLPGLAELPAIFTTVTDAVIDFKNGAVLAFAQVKDGVNDGLVVANSRLESFQNMVFNIKNGLSNFASKVKEAFSPVGEEIKAAFSDVTITDAIGTGMIAGIAIVIKKLIDNISSLVGNFSDLTNSVAGVLDGVKDALKTWQTDLKAGTLLKIAMAVALLAVSVVALSFVDGDKLRNGLIGVSLLLGEIVATMELLKKLKITNIEGAALTMVVIAVAISILAGAMAKLKDFQTWDQTWPAIAAMGALMTGLVVATKQISKNVDNSADFIQTAVGIVILAVALRQMAKAFVTFGEMKIDEIEKGLLAVGVLLTEIGLFMQATDKIDGMANGSKTIMAMATSMILLAVAVKMFGEMPIEVLEQGLISVGGLILGLAAAMKIIGDLKIQGGLTTIIGMAAALTLLIIPVKQLGEMDQAKLIQGLAAVSVMLITLTAAMMAIDETNILAAGAGLLLLATGLTLLTIPIKVLGSMPWQALALGLGAIIIVLGAFVVVARLLAPVAPALLAIGGAFALVGIAALAVGMGLAQLALGFATLAAVGAVGAAAIIGALAVLVAGFIELAPQIAEAVAIGIASFLEALALAYPSIMMSISIMLLTLLKTIQDVAPALIKTVLIVLTELLEGLATYAPRMIQAAFDLLLAFLESLVNNADELVDLGIRYIIAFITGITSKLPEMMQTGVDFIIAFINGIADASVQLADAAFNAMITFINGLATSIDENAPLLVEAMTKLINSLINAAILVFTTSISQLKERGQAIMESGFIQGIKDKFEDAKTAIKDTISGMILSIKNKISDFKSAAGEVINGFVQGIKDKFSDAVAAASDLGTKILDSAKEALGINSPSKEFAEIGMYSDLGLIQGLKAYAAGVYGAASDVGTGAVSSMKKSFNGISAIIDGNMDLNPVITPTLDLTNVTNGVKEISTMFANRQLAVSGDIGQNGGNELTGTTYQFTQNNYSPKALSRAEIYRQTRNQFAKLKAGLV